MAFPARLNEPNATQFETRQRSLPMERQFTNLKNKLAETAISLDLLRSWLENTTRVPKVNKSQSARYIAPKEPPDLKELIVKLDEYGEISKIINRRGEECLDALRHFETGDRLGSFTSPSYEDIKGRFNNVMTQINDLDEQLKYLRSRPQPVAIINEASSEITDMLNQMSSTKVQFSDIAIEKRSSSTQKIRKVSMKDQSEQYEDPTLSTKPKLTQTYESLKLDQGTTLESQSSDRQVHISRSTSETRRDSSRKLTHSVSENQVSVRHSSQEGDVSSKKIPMYEGASSFEEQTSPSTSEISCGCEEEISARKNYGFPKTYDSYEKEPSANRGSRISKKQKSRRRSSSSAKIHQGAVDKETSHTPLRKQIEAYDSYEEEPSTNRGSRISKKQKSRPRSSSSAKIHQGAVDEETSHTLLRKQIEAYDSYEEEPSANRGSRISKKQKYRPRSSSSAKIHQGAVDEETSHTLLRKQIEAYDSYEEEPSTNRGSRISEKQKSRRRSSSLAKIHQGAVDRETSHTPLRKQIEDYDSYEEEATPCYHRFKKHTPPGESPLSSKKQIAKRQNLSDKENLTSRTRLRNKIEAYDSCEEESFAHRGFRVPKKQISTYQDFSSSKKQIVQQPYSSTSHIPSTNQVKTYDSCEEETSTRRDFGTSKKRKSARQDSSFTGKQIVKHPSYSEKEQHASRPLRNQVEAYDSCEEESSAYRGFRVPKKQVATHQDYFTEKQTVKHPSYSEKEQHAYRPLRNQVEAYDSCEEESSTYRCFRVPKKQVATHQDSSTGKQIVKHQGHSGREEYTHDDPLRNQAGVHDKDASTHGSFRVPEKQVATTHQDSSMGKQIVKHQVLSGREHYTYDDPLRNQAGAHDKDASAHGGSSVSTKPVAAHQDFSSTEKQTIKHQQTSGRQNYTSDTSFKNQVEVYDSGEEETSIRIPKKQISTQQKSSSSEKQISKQQNSSDKENYTTSSFSDKQLSTTSHSSKINGYESSYQKQIPRHERSPSAEGQIVENKNINAAAESSQKESPEELAAKLKDYLSSEKQTDSYPDSSEKENYTSYSSLEYPFSTTSQSSLKIKTDAYEDVSENQIPEFGISPTEQQIGEDKSENTALHVSRKDGSEKHIFGHRGSSSSDKQIKLQDASEKENFTSYSSSENQISTSRSSSKRKIHAYGDEKQLPRYERSPSTEGKTVKNKEGKENAIYSPGKESAGRRTSELKYSSSDEKGKICSFPNIFKKKSSTHRRISWSEKQISEHPDYYERQGFSSPNRVRKPIPFETKVVQKKPLTNKTNTSGCYCETPLQASSSDSNSSVHLSVRNKSNAKRYK